MASRIDVRASFLSLSKTLMILQITRDLDLPFKDLRQKKRRKASHRKSDDIRFIYFCQMDGVVIWIYAIFLFIVCENKNLKEANLSDKFQRPHCQQL